MCHLRVGWMQDQQATLTEDLTRVKDELAKESVTRHSMMSQLSIQSKKLEDCQGKLEVQVIEVTNLRKQNTDLDADFDNYRKASYILHACLCSQDLSRF